VSTTLLSQYKSFELANQRKIEKEKIQKGKTEAPSLRKEKDY